MTIAEFWHSAFIASLATHSPAEAKAIADESPEVAIKHWRNVDAAKGRLVPSCISYGYIPLTGQIGYRDTVVNQAGALPGASE